MKNEKWKIFRLFGEPNERPNVGCAVNKPPDTTMPHKVNCMAEWGKNRKVPDSLIVGSGAYVSP
jgi:hypothetical protein